MSQHKRLLKEFRELRTTVYERELKNHLTELLESFQEWKKGQISSGELSTIIHEYDRGPSKEMFVRYNNLESEISIAYGLARGLLQRAEISDEAYEIVKNQVRFFESQNEED